MESGHRAAWECSAPSCQHVAKAAIDTDDLSGDEGLSRIEEPGGQRRYLLRFPESSEGVHGDGGGGAGRILPDSSRHIRAD